MRTKILKFGMPMMAFLLAIVFAFANVNNTPVENNALITGYVLSNAGCTPVPTNCVIVSGGPVCKYDGKTVHRNPNCTNFLYEWMP
ncbi:DUF6520 family protein [Aequorivita sp. CIP111184]|uniref:DUF6520 family protein n=1 Tax=Aequorivita sp. CIP111184 TaxID=2211356 RepID=UPI000DBBBB72|nr:DUF6520 family protein [Aequorivita sp. CIP111184]SRX52218.1 hypothetical protein AEQU1_00081 [Aequorivita sp. CIP111184]